MREGGKWKEPVMKGERRGQRMWRWNKEITGKKVTMKGRKEKKSRRRRRDNEGSG